jgi:hypothetical protein
VATAARLARPASKARACWGGSSTLRIAVQSAEPCKATSKTAAQIRLEHNIGQIRSRISAEPHLTSACAIAAIQCTKSYKENKYDESIVPTCNPYIS